MSNYLAIATVTETLRQFLQAAISSLITGANATAVRPGLIGQSALTPAVGTNVFLYQVVPNAAWRNTDLPSRNGGGDITHRPRAALDLHYLLSFYGKETDLEAQRLLGRVTQTLHSQPILTRKQVRDAVSSANFLAGSNLAEEVEQVRVTPLSLSLEEMSKVWSVLFQTQYALSVAYQASVVLIEADQAPRQVLPVRQRNVRVLPYQRPFIEEVTPQILEVGNQLIIRGRNLKSDLVKVRLSSTETAPTSLTSDQVNVALPPGLPAGVNTAQIVQLLDFGSGSPSEPHRLFESNVTAFVVAPKLAVPAGPEPVFGTVTRGSAFPVTVAPPVGRTQEARLIVGHRSITLPSRPASAPPATTALPFTIPADFPTGEFLVRVQVDGAQSKLSEDATGFTGPKVVIAPGATFLRCTAITFAATANGVTARVTITDANAAPVSGADVSLVWSLPPEGAALRDGQTTDNAGVARFTADGPAGFYQVAVEHVSPATVAGVLHHLDQAGSTLVATFVKP